MHIKNLLERNAFVIAITLTILIAILSLISISGFNFGFKLNEVNNSDKLGHLIAYFTLSCSWFFALKFHDRSFKEKIIIVTLLITYGIILEGLQESMTTYRKGDFYDVMANSTGVFIATIFFNKLNYWFNSVLK